jgi:hypothetical protein
MDQAIASGSPLVDGCQLRCAPARTAFKYHDAEHAQELAVVQRDTKDRERRQRGDCVPSLYAEHICVHQMEEVGRRPVFAASLAT